MHLINKSNRATNYVNAQTTRSLADWFVCLFKSKTSTVAKPKLILKLRHGISGENEISTLKSKKQPKINSLKFDERIDFVKFNRKMLNSSLTKKKDLKTIDRNKLFCKQLEQNRKKVGKYENKSEKTKKNGKNENKERKTNKNEKKSEKTETNEKK